MFAGCPTALAEAVTTAVEMDGRPELGVHPPDDAGPMSLLVQYSVSGDDLSAGPSADHILFALLGELSVEAYARAFSLGAGGVAHVDMRLSTLVDVMKAAARGKALIPAFVAQVISSRALAGTPPSTLDRRERQVASMMRDGRTTRSIAHELGYSERTVRRIAQGVRLKVAQANDEDLRISEIS